MLKKSVLRGTSTALLCIISLGTQAVAQTEPPPAASAATLEAVVVTATRRQSTVQTTAISLTAISQKDIQERGLSNFSDLAQSVPGVSMRTSGAGQTEFEMRGMSSFGGNSPTVGFYLGDVSVSGPAFNVNGKVVIDPNLYDINRVEVLRGPQGDLFGSGSMGGTIRIVPNAPNPAGFEASAEAILGDTDGGGFNHGENAMVNVPLGSGAAALRVVASESHDSGWIDRNVIASGDFPLETNSSGVVDPTGTVRGNVSSAPVAAAYKGVNETELTSARASILWKPSDPLSITPMVFYQEISQPNGLSYVDSDPGTNTFYQPFNVPESFLDRFNLYSLNLQYHFRTFDVTSTTAKWYRESDTLEDGSESLQWGAALPSYYPSQGGAGPSWGQEEDLSQQTSQELRAASSGNTKFQWLVGYYYSDFHSAYDLFGGNPDAAPIFGSTDLFTLIQPVKIIQQALFTDLSYQLTPTLKATVGVRRYSYDGSVNTAQSGVFSLSGSNAYAHVNTFEHNQGVNPKYTLSYNATSQLLLYTTIAKGFRPGGGNQPVPVTGPVGSGCEADLQAIYRTTSVVPAPATFDPDHVWSYEAGEKLTALESHLSIDSAVYFENWSDIQQFIPVPCGFSFQANAGDAHIYGSELEIKASVVPGLILSGNVGYNHSAIVTTPFTTAGVALGSPILDVPTWTAAESLTYRRGISDRLLIMLRADNEYVGSRTDLCYSICQLPSYDLVNLRAGVEGPRWSAALFADNVLNKRTFLNDTVSVNITLPTYNRVVVNKPLTVGIDLHYTFGGLE